MKKFFDKVLRFLKKAVNILMFLTTIGIIVLSLPKERKFRFEIIKGKFWQYDDLYAPFSFAVSKSEDDLDKEYKAITDKVRPYFKVKSKIEEKKLESFNRLFNSFWDESGKDFLSDDFKNDTTVKQKIDSYCNKLLDNVYTRGVLYPGDFKKYIDKKEQLVLIDSQVGRTVAASSLFTPKSSYQYINNRIKEDIDSLHTNWGIGIDFFKKLSIDKYVDVNLVYDQEKSEEERNAQIERVTLNRGIVQLDERVISRGERLDDEKTRVLQSLKSEYEQRYGNKRTYYIVLLGQICLISSFVFVLFFFLKIYTPDTFKSLRKILFILLQIVSFSVASAFIVKVYPQAIYVVPFAIIPILVISFFDSLTAIFAYIIVILIVGFLVPDSYQFVFLQFIVGTLAIFSIGRLFRRAQLVLSTLLVLLGYSFIYTAYRVIGDGSFDVFNEEYFTYLGFFAMNALFVNLSYPMIYMFEKSFGFLSDITLIELSNTNLPVLRELAESAPGTFQHTLQVANLAEGAANIVDADPLLTRTGALYHDIGKLYKPEFFTENQSEHSNKVKYSHIESADIIINHVNEGRERARKAKLPRQIIDFIVTHHGDSKTLYFYRSYKNENPEEQIDEALFTYPGPKPFSKETALVMMADALEAASRSLKEYTPESLSKLVSLIIDGQRNDAQFDNVDLTFKDITNLKAFFTDKLLNIYHSRIAYPKENKPA